MKTVHITVATVHIKSGCIASLLLSSPLLLTPGSRSTLERLRASEEEEAHSGHSDRCDSFQRLILLASFFSLPLPLPSPLLPFVSSLWWQLELEGEEEVLKKETYMLAPFVLSVSLSRFAAATAAAVEYSSCFPPHFPPSSSSSCSIPRRSALAAQVCARGTGQVVSTRLDSSRVEQGAEL